MNESVNDIAKKLGIVKFSFKEIFILPDSEKERVEQLAEKGICIDESSHLGIIVPGLEVVQACLLARTFRICRKKMLCL